MKKRYQKQLASIRCVIDFCIGDNGAPVVQSVPAFEESVEVLKIKEAAINELLVLHSEKLEGYTKARRNRRERLAFVSYPYLKRGVAYANGIGDTILSARLNYSLSSLQRMDFNVLGQVMRKCYTTLKAVPVNDLLKYGITYFAEWDDALISYNEYISVPRNKVCDRKALGKQLVNLIKEANYFMRSEINPQAAAFVKLNEAFYLNYKNCLKQVSSGVRHTRLNVTVITDAGDACSNCEVRVDTLTKNGRAFKEVIGTTDIKGMCTIKVFEDGVRTITVSGAGIVTKTFEPTYFEQGKSVDKVLVCAVAGLHLSPEGKESYFR